MSKTKRLARIKRITKETRVNLILNLDGKGKGSIQTPVHFLNHMLELFTKHGLFDLQLKATGDTEVDDHHTVEDIGIVLGEAVAKALGDKKGIERFASSFVPMDEVLTQVVIDISGRSGGVVDSLRDFYESEDIRIMKFDPQLIEEFFKAFCDNAKVSLHIRVIRSGNNMHHLIESVFKAFGRALSKAVAYNPKIKGIPSTKGKL